MFTIILVLYQGFPFYQSRFPGAQGMDLSFPDLEGHWAKDAVLSLSRSGIVSGYPDGLFHPERLVNLGEALKIVALSRGLKKSSISGVHWAYPYFLVLSEEGVLPFDSFEPERNPSRGEIAKIIKNSFYPEMETLSDPSFEDLPFDHPAYNSVEVLHQLGILLGREDGYFYPQEGISRAELATIISRILQLEEVALYGNTPFGPVNLSIKPSRVPQGGFLKITFFSPQDLEVEILFEETKIYSPIKGFVIVPIPLWEDTGPKEISLFAKNGDYSFSLKANITVSLNSVPSETIELPSESIDLLSPELLQEEREEIYRVVSIQSPIIPDLPFDIPLNSPILSSFGTERVYPGWGSDNHWGVDLQGNEGDEVRASGKGRVVLAKELYSRGKTIIMDHGSGLFTLYYHLSAFLSKEGDEVKKGEVIGLVGSTGAVTGPHLHWEARIGKVPINPIILLNKGGF